MTRRAHYNVAVIGGGPAGLAAAIAAADAGARDVLIIERDIRLGGILNQCIHDGFGLHRFKEALSGPEYAARFICAAKERGLSVMLGTIALSLSADRRVILSRMGELFEIEADAIVLATGCRERARGALGIPGTRPSGVYTAGTAQTLMNMENIMPGRRVVILGSGDIGLIMARRVTLEGARVEAVFELLPYSSGLPRNIQQCLVDYGIPLHLSTTIINIHGAGRVEGVTTASVDERRRPIAGSERFVPCDTLLLSVGLIPENELARGAGIEINPVTGGPNVDENCMTNLSGIFSCGNSLHVHDLVDWVSDEAGRTGSRAAQYSALSTVKRRAAFVCSGECVELVPAGGVRYVTPCRIGKPAPDENDNIYNMIAFRVTEPSRRGSVQIIANGRVIKEERRARLHPAEMVWMKLTGGEVSCLFEDEVRALEVRVKWLTKEQ